MPGQANIMRLSISNLAWNPEHDERITYLLNFFAVDAIEIAPSKYFPISGDIGPGRIDAVRRSWQNRGIDIIAMQSLLFGMPGLNMFGKPSVQQEMLLHLARICGIGSELGVKRLVFGSPKNRDRSGLDITAAMAIGIDFFQRLGDIAAASGCIVCLEPNPTSYGCNFMTGTAEAAEMVRKTDHPSIRLQFDIGAITENGEDAADLLKSYHQLIGHVHISEPGLRPIGTSLADHAHIGALIHHFLPPEMSGSIEMLTPSAEDPTDTVRRAIKFAIKHYRHSDS